MQSGLVCPCNDAIQELSQDWHRTIWEHNKLIHGKRKSEHQLTADKMQSLYNNDFWRFCSAVFDDKNANKQQETSLCFLSHKLMSISVECTTLRTTMKCLYTLLGCHTLRKSKFLSTTLRLLWKKLCRRSRLAVLNHHHIPRTVSVIVFSSVVSSRWFI